MAQTEALTHGAEEPLVPGLDIPTGKFGMWLFLMSEIMFFTALIGSYIVLRLGSAGWPEPSTILNIPLLGWNTFVLLSSSLTMALALHAVQQGRQAAAVRLLLATAALGATFLGIKLFDYAHMWEHGFRMSTSLFGSCYYLLTGFHGLHVLSGVILMLYLAAGTARGQFHSANFTRVECGGLYWHFIDLVWVVLFAILCLV